MSYKVQVLVGAFSEYCTTFDIVKHHQTSLTCAFLFTCLWSWTIGSHFHCGLSVIKTSIHTVHTIHIPTILPIHIKNVLRAGSVGRPLWVSALAGGLQASGAQKVSWISRNCVMFLLYFLTATLSNCQLNYCKMLHKFWESCISSLKASFLVKWLFCVMLIIWCPATIS